MTFLLRALLLFALPALLLLGCEKDNPTIPENVLYSSDPVVSRVWNQKKHAFETDEVLIGFKLSARYRTPYLFPYNGHVLIDYFAVYPL